MKPIEKLQKRVFTDEQRREAEARLARVESLGEEVRAKDKARLQNYREMFDAKPEESRDKIAWRAVVTFANTNMSYDTGAELGAKYLEGALSYFLHVLRDELGEPEFADVAAAMEAGRDRKAAFRHCAQLEQVFLRRLLTWLCEPDKHPELSEECTKWSLRMAGAILWKAEVNDRFDATGNNGDPYFFLKRVTDYGFLMSPICKFIVSRMERYNEGELALAEAIPVRICAREGCGKFLVPARTDRKKFCSTECLQQSHPPRTGAENRDYMFFTASNMNRFQCSARK